MRVLVTRPEGGARRTAERLGGLGHVPVLLPLMVAEHHPGAVGEALRQPHAALAITSAEAVRALKSLGSALTPHLHEPVFAVGEATALAARQAGFTDLRIAEGTGASMVALFGGEIARLTGAAPLLYFAGTPRSPDLEAGLAGLGVALRVAETYTMHPLPIDQQTADTALRHPPVDAVLLYSRQTAQRFFEVAASGEAMDALRHVPLLCLSGNVADAVPDGLRGNVRVAARPDEDSLLALL